MKTRLTCEESRHLIDLGVPKEKASKVAWAQIRDAKGNEIPEIEQYKGVSDKPFSAMHVGFQSFSTDDIFALDDFLNGEILPKELGKGGPYLTIYRNMVGYASGLEYEGLIWEVSFKSDELIDALYYLAAWHYSRIERETPKGYFDSFDDKK